MLRKQTHSDLNDLHGFIWLGHAEPRPAGFQDACLLTRNFLQGTADSKAV